MDKNETEKIKEGLFNIPSLVAKMEAYFSKKEEVAPAAEEKKEEAPVVDAPIEQDFSAVITAIEKTFAKSADFEAFKVALTAESTNSFAKLSEENKVISEKVAKQDEILKEVFELVKKIADAPVEESKFSKKDGAKITAKGNMNTWMEEAKEISKTIFK